MITEYSSLACKSALSPSGLPGLTYSLNPYVGCEHGCAYCYAPSVLRDRQLAESWGQVVRAKLNIARILAAEVSRKPKGTVGVSTVTDPYQPREASLKLTRRCIEILSSNDFPVSIQTKSGLVLRDTDLIGPERFDVGVTITTMDRGLSRILEPKASPPDERARVVERFSAMGVRTWIFLGPIIPEVNDSEAGLRSVIELAAKTGSKILYDKLNPRPWVMERLGTALERERPGLARRLASMAGGGPWHDTRSSINSLCRELGVKCEAAFEMRAKTNGK